MPEIKFNCPKCGICIQTDDSVQGARVECPKCAYHFAVPAPEIKPGLQIGGFIIEKRLGKGGMGEVWLAYQKTMDRKVAIKILSPSLTEDPEFVKRFLREVKTSAKLIHPNIVTAFDAGVERGIHYLAVEYIDGEELGKLIHAQKIMPEKEALRIVRGIAEGLAYAWDRFKILHRDIKPANIMICKDGSPKLMDLGISKNLADDSSVTMTGVVVGTPCYISPEQAKSDKNIDFRSDIYSLGATLYHLVTGQIPFDGDSSISIMTKHVLEPLESPDIRNPNLSKQCSSLVEKMMRKNPDDRQQSWDEVVHDIDAVISGRNPSTGKSLVASVMFNTRVQKTASSLKPTAILSAVILIFAMAFATLIIRNAAKRAQDDDSSKRNDGTAPPTKTGELQKDAPQTPADPPPPPKKEEDTDGPSEEEATPSPAEEAAPEEIATAPESTPAEIEETREEPPPPPGTPPQASADMPGDLRRKLIEANPGMDVKKCIVKEEKGKLKVDLKGSNVTNLAPLSEFPVTHLDISNTNVKDISPLGGLDLVYLCISNTRVTDITPLKDMLNMKRLEMSNTKVSDLMPIGLMSLDVLAIDGTGASNMQPFLHMDLVKLSFSPKNFLGKSGSFQAFRDLHEMRSLKYIDTTMKPDSKMMKASEFWIKMDKELRKLREKSQNTMPPGRDMDQMDDGGERPIRQPQRGR